MNLVAVSANIESHNQNNVKVLQNGSSVLVRVIADKGNGKYQGSVAGVRVNLKSANPLQVGQTFVATVTARNGVIQISPRENQIINQNQFIIAEQSGENISHLLSALGIAPEELNEHIILQMKQLEMKLDRNVFSIIRNISLKFSGKEKKVSELITILKQKGIELNSDVLLQLLDLIDGNNSEETDTAKKSLKIINHKSGWIFLPYEIVENDFERVIGNGIIKLLILEDKRLKKMILNVCFEDKKYKFGLDFENKKCKNIKMNISPCSDSNIQQKIEALKSKLSFLGKANVEWVFEDEIDGTACSDESFLRIGGVV